MVNKVLLVGRLGRDPETRFTQGGQAVCNFTVATDESFTDRSGTKQKRAEWHRIVVWGKLAEICQQYLTKGQLVYLEGKIQSRTYEDKKSGAQKQTTEIVVFNMKMLGGGQNREEAGEQEAQDTGAEEEVTGF